MACWGSVSRHELVEHACGVGGGGGGRAEERSARKESGECWSAGPCLQNPDDEGASERAARERSLAVSLHPPHNSTMGQQTSQPSRPVAAIDLVADVPGVVFKEALGE